MYSAMWPAPGLNDTRLNRQTEAGSIAYLDLAKSWRYVAEQADWQDPPKYAALSGSLD